MSGWTDYMSGSDSEDERLAGRPGRIVFDPARGGSFSRTERTMMVRIIAERDRQLQQQQQQQQQAAQSLANNLRAMQGGQIAVKSFQAFGGRPHKLNDFMDGTMLGLVGIVWGSIFLGRILHNSFVT